MEARFAFTAQYWGHGAVVCRAVEDRPGPVVEQQFGEFQTWTQAQAFATRLNKGLDLDPSEVRRIVTSSLLASVSVVQEALRSVSLRKGSTVQARVRAAQMRFILADLTHALKLCRSTARLSDVAAHRVLLHARWTLQRSSHFLGSHPGDPRSLQQIALQSDTLRAAIRQVTACLP